MMNDADVVMKENEALEMKYAASDSEKSLLELNITTERELASTAKSIQEPYPALCVHVPNRET